MDVGPARQPRSPLAFPSGGWATFPMLGTVPHSCLHFPPTILPYPTVMEKAEYSEINVCMITWLGLSHVKKVTECKRMDCHGVCRLYGSCPEEAFACWMKTRTRISSAYWLVKNEIQIQSPRKKRATWEKWGRGFSHLHFNPIKTHRSNITIETAQEKPVSYRLTLKRFPFVKYSLFC